MGRSPKPETIRTTVFCWDHGGFPRDKLASLELSSLQSAAAAARITLADPGNSLSRIGAAPFPLLLAHGNAPELEMILAAAHDAPGKQPLIVARLTAQTALRTSHRIYQRAGKRDVLVLSVRNMALLSDTKTLVSLLRISLHEARAIATNQDLANCSPYLLQLFVAESFPLATVTLLLLVEFSLIKLQDDQREQVNLGRTTQGDERPLTDWAFPSAEAQNSILATWRYLWTNERQTQFCAETRRVFSGGVALPPVLAAMIQWSSAKSPQLSLKHDLQTCMTLLRNILGGATTTTI